MWLIDQLYIELGHYLVKKFLFPQDAYVVLCPTWSKNLERTQVLTCIALLSDGFSIPNNSWILVSIWDLNVKEHGKAHEHNFPSRSFLQTEQYPAKKVTNSVSISDCVVVHPGIWQTKGDSCVSDIFEIWRVFFFLIKT